MWANFLHNSHLTVQTEEDEHQEEEAGPKRRQRHHSNSLGVCNECKTRTCIPPKKNSHTGVSSKQERVFQTIQDRMRPKINDHSMEQTFPFLLGFSHISFSMWTLRIVGDIAIYLTVPTVWNHVIVTIIYVYVFNIYICFSMDFSKCYFLLSPDV